MTENKILTQNVAIGLDGRKHRRNLNILVCGGSGAGKTRFFAKPNIMNANTSFVCLDPKGELLRDTGNLLKAKGYDICQRHFKMSIFAEMGCRFLQGSIQVLYSLIHHITCRFEARQALIYQLASGLTGENGKYNYSKAVHLYPPFFDIFCSPKNYKTASALTTR